MEILCLLHKIAIVIAAGFCHAFTFHILIITILHSGHLFNQCHRYNVLKRNLNFKSFTNKPVRVKAHIINCSELITTDVRTFCCIPFGTSFHSKLPLMLSSFFLHAFLAHMHLCIPPLQHPLISSVVMPFLSFLFLSNHFVGISSSLCIFCVLFFLSLPHHLH